MKSGAVSRSIVVAIAVLMMASTGCDHDEWLNGDLAGTRWRLIAWSMSSLHPSDFTITAAFDESTISGIAAVNRYSAPCSTTSGGAFALGAMAMTEMAGSEPEMRAEAMYVELLLRTRKYNVTASTLTLRDEQSNELLIFAKQ